MKKRFLSILLAVCLVPSLLPAAALAADSTVTVSEHSLTAQHVETDEDVDNLSIITISALQAMIDQTSGDTITLNSTVEASSGDTLDLKGKTVVLGKDSENDCCVILVPENTSLDVKGNGTIISTSDGGTYPGEPDNYVECQIFDVECGAKLTIENGTYQSASVGFVNAFGADITIDDCTFVCTADPVKYDYGSFIDLNVGTNGSVRRGSTLTMLAGSISEQTPSDSVGMIGITAYDGASVTLGKESDHTGPNITVGRIPLLTMLSPYHKDTDTVNGAFTVYGGTYKSTFTHQDDNDFICSALFIRNGGNYEISGGTFQSACQPAITASLQPTPSSKGAVIPVPADARANITITGGFFRGASGIYSSTKSSTQTNDNTLTISGGKFSAKPDAASVAKGFYAVVNQESDSAAYPYLVSDQNNTFPFTDVASGSYCYAAVAWAVGKKITSGTSDTTFSPADTCTRAQAVTFLWRAMGSPEPTSAVNPFTDVSSGAYYYKAVLWAVEHGITNGTSSTTFGPDENVSRAQTVTFQWRVAGQTATVGGNPFTDVDQNSYYGPAVQWASSNGITTGTSSTTFGPTDLCLRGQIVTFLYRQLGK